MGNGRLLSGRRSFLFRKEKPMNAKEIAQQGCTVYSLVCLYRTLLKMNYITLAQYNELVDRVTEYYSVMIV